MGERGCEGVHVAYDHDDFEMALTVLKTVVSVPTEENRRGSQGILEWPRVEYSWAGDEHGRLTVTQSGRLPRLGDRIDGLGHERLVRREFSPHCDSTINLYDRIHAMRGDTVEAVWEIAARGRSQ